MDQRPFFSIIVVWILPLLFSARYFGERFSRRRSIVAGEA
jgi:hypothetical protein